jgi:murein DD-endopeptidase MepM/ murein hydrolase activator NlpD
LARSAFLIRKTMGLALLACLVLAGLSPAAGAESQASDLQRLIQKTRQEIFQKKKKERSVLGNLQKEQQNLNRLERNYDQIKSKLDEVQDQYSLSRKELRGLQNDLRTLEENRGARQAKLNQRLVAIYKYGPRPYLEILFEARDFADFVSKYTTVAYIVKHDLNALDELQEAKAAVAEQQQQVQAKTKQVESEFKKVASLKEKVSREQDKIAYKVKVTKQELNEIQSDRVRLEKALAEYEETSRQLEREIRQDQSASGKEGLGSGRMIWPVRGRLSSPFGYRYHPVLKSRRLHNGQDIAVPTGTPVAAADSGVVLVSGWKGGYGYFVAIDHGKGISTGYGHNSRLLVAVGERVTKGQTIALSGSTGLSTGPHVHFEVRINGVPVNPRPYLP